MKLRNKKTGEIKEFDGVKVLKNSDCTIAQFSYDNLAELNEEWEDYEEPKEYWCINSNGEVLSCTKGISEDSRQSIGNYFETREEAEKAVEKLKAITRLKSCGFKFKGWRTADLGADKYYFVITAESDGAGTGDLDLLFGGKE